MASDLIMRCWKRPMYLGRLPKDQVAKQIPHEVDPAEQLDPGRTGQLYCIECGNTATCFCPECGDCFCESCFERLHAKAAAQPQPARRDALRLRWGLAEGRDVPGENFSGRNNHWAKLANSNERNGFGKAATELVRAIPPVRL
ncbi:unnamed protein product [Prorocentrum cordatum]|uniref:B box-type domain-containing protein n=1 Tax=Prorocentrum cordatum TaxID=2364126 RepID=A0ABN9WVH6_9DINO|nr:unnamed protein product [Polarella glacialis]